MSKILLKKTDMQKYIIIVMLLFVSISFGQRKYAANQYFKDFAYVKSAKLYESIYKRGDSSKLVLSRLADSHYMNSNSERAVFWYNKLFTIHENTDIKSEYYFKYSQSLKSIGDYEKSDKWLLKLKDFNGSDSRLDALVANKDYLKDYTEKPKTFVKIYNLAANTKFSDYGVFLSGKKVYFSSSRPNGKLKNSKLYAWNKQPFYDIYEGLEVTTGANPTFLNVKKEETINTKFHDASAVVTRDGKTMYFTRDNYDGKRLRGDKERVSHLKIYKAELIGGKWKNIKEVSFNDDAYSVGHPALSVDEKELYFVSDMPNGFGLTDLYKVSILGNDKYGIPNNLGKEMNTEGNEMFPYISEDNTLYFSSNGHLGLGGLDVFKTSLNEPTFNKIENLGAPINGKKDDFSFILNKELSRGYFSSNRLGGKGDDDMYSFVIYVECNKLLEGIVTNKQTGAIIPDAKVSLVDKEGTVIANVVSNGLGKFSFGEVDCALNYTVLGAKTKFESDSVFAQMDNEAVNSVNVKLSLEPVLEVAVIVDDQIIINPIRFDYDEFYIRDQAKYELNKIVAILKANPEIVIKIESHTDSRGRRSYNRLLSDRRAKSTRDYIISRGIDRNRIESAIGYGEDRLLNECGDINAKICTEEEHQLNRRSYFYIVRGNSVKAVNE